MAHSLTINLFSNCALETEASSECGAERGPPHGPRSEPEPLVAPVTATDSRQNCDYTINCIFFLIDRTAAAAVAGDVDDQEKHQATDRDGVVNDVKPWWINELLDRLTSYGPCRVADRNKQPTKCAIRPHFSERISPNAV